MAWLISIAIVASFFLIGIIISISEDGEKNESKVINTTYELVKLIDGYCIQRIIHYDNNSDKLSYFNFSNTSVIPYEMCWSWPDKKIWNLKDLDAAKQRLDEIVRGASHFPIDYKIIESITIDNSLKTDDNSKLTKVKLPKSDEEALIELGMKLEAQGKLKGNELDQNL